MDRVFSFLLWPKRGARGPWKQGRKKRGSITCRRDRANEANKMFIIWLCWLFWFWEGDRELEVRTATYGPGIDQSQHAKLVSHIIIWINALFTRHKLTWVRPGLKLTQVSFCRVNTANPGSTQVSLEKCRVNKPGLVFKNKTQVNKSFISRVTFD